MTTRTTVPAGAPTWVDVSTSDQARTLQFYDALFGWTREEPQPELGGYANFLRQGQRIAGCVPAMPGSPTDVWTVYFATRDAEKTAELVTTSGGAVHAPAMPVLDLGTMAVLGDRGGAAFGVWQPGTHQGTLVLDEPGAPSWFELHTRDYDRTLAFYADVLGVEIATQADVPGFRYSALVVDGEQVAGVMDASGWPAAPGSDGWGVYWHSDDVDASLARVEQLGGTVVQPRDDTPYGVLASCTDPTGALLKLRTPPA